jgi:hypothetical protein
VSPEELSDEELRAKIEEELKRLKVSDVLLQSCYTLSSLGYGKMAGPPEDRDLEQARLAIEALRALTPLLEGALPAELTRDLGQVTANMQLAYANAAAEEKPEPPAGEPKASRSEDSSGEGVGESEAPAAPTEGEKGER